MSGEQLCGKTAHPFRAQCMLDAGHGGPCATGKQMSERTGWYKAITNELEAAVQSSVPRGDFPDQDEMQVAQESTDRAIELREQLDAYHTGLLAELARVQRLPELEWAEVTAQITVIMARLAREGHQEEAKEMLAALDKGKTYVTRRLAERDRLREALERIASTGCTRVHGGNCDRYPHWTETAEYLADQVCDPCIARRALEGGQDDG